jgi:hypothetical protein
MLHRSPSRPELISQALVQIRGAAQVEWGFADRPQRAGELEAEWEGRTWVLETHYASSAGRVTLTQVDQRGHRVWRIRHELRSIGALDGVRPEVKRVMRLLGQTIENNRREFGSATVNGGSAPHLNGGAG